MSSMDGIFDYIINVLVFPGGLSALILGLVLKGMDRKAGARLQRRVGPPIIQPFYDLVKLAGKENCVPETARKFIFLNAPIAGSISMALAMVLIPISGVYTPDASSGDLLALLYLLAVPAVVLMLSGSSSGSGFGALGFSREMSLILALVSVALKVGSETGSVITFSLSEIVRVQQVNGPFLFDPVMHPAFITYLLFVPAGLGVAPFDVAEAETEILEGPLLEYSGLIRTATGRMRMDQAFLFYFKWPEITGITSLLTVLSLG